MDERWNTLRPIFSDLLKIVRPSTFIDRLLDVSLITLEELKRIKTYDNTEGARMLLLSILPRKGLDSYDQFLSVLKETEGQEHIAQQIIENAKRRQKRTVLREEEEFWTISNRLFVFQGKRKILELRKELKKEKKERKREEKKLIKVKKVKSKLEQKVKKDEVTIIGLKKKVRRV